MRENHFFFQESIISNIVELIEVFTSADDLNWDFQKFDRNFNEWNDNSPWKNPSCTAMTLPTLSSCIMSSWFTLFLFILDVHNLSLLLFFFILCWSWHVYLPPTLQDVDTLVMKVGVVYHHYLCPTCVITMVLL